MALNYRGRGTLDDRVEALEKRWSLATITIWTGVVCIIAGLLLLTAGMWSLHRAGLF
jgi:hypothetical protein